MRKRAQDAEPRPSERRHKVNAVILAGGKGSRLAARGRGLPKPLVPVNGKPLLDYQLELLARHGATQVTLLCGYGAAAIRDFAGDGSRWGLRVDCVDETTPLGTAGAVIAALYKLARRVSGALRRHHA